MSVTVVQQAPAGKVAWNSGLLDCCAPPGGFGTCLYVYFCPNCAAGDVARFAGRDYCMSCCVIPAFLSPLGAICWWACDRQAFVIKYNIADSTDCMSHCCKLYFCTFCSLIQALNHANQMALKNTVPGQNNGGSTIVVMSPSQPQPMMMAPQPYMMQPQPMMMQPQPVMMMQQQQQQPQVTVVRA